MLSQIIREEAQDEVAIELQRRVFAAITTIRGGISEVLRVCACAAAKWGTARDGAKGGGP